MKEPATKESNYLLELLWVIDGLGRLASDLLVNFHKFNSVPPHDKGLRESDKSFNDRIDLMIARISQLQKLYNEQYQNSAFNFER